MPNLQLSSLPWLARLGLLGLVGVMLGGLAASATHLYWHHGPRDERPGLTMDDITGTYHGVERVAPLLTALERNHPPELPEADRATLLTWLGGDRVSEDYDNLDLGDAAPAEILARSCTSCHARDSDDPVAAELPLLYWDDVKDVAFSRQINPTSREILAASTHAHALSMAPLAVVIALLAFLTRWPRGLVGLLVGVMGVCLFADLASWWLAREMAGLVWVIVAGGGAYNLASALLLLMVGVDLVRP
jgi:hypothetical protein